MTALTLGTKLQNGAFTIGKVLGQGGFGITYFGSDTRLNRLVAIKEFFPLGCTRLGNDVQPHGLLDAQSYSNARTKFLQEARTLAQFRHAGIVHIYTFCEENNTAYLVMEFLRGQTLAQLVETHGALPEDEAIEIIKNVGAAVEQLHRNKMLHRDIKPDNIIVCDDNRVVLIDFGLTKKVEESVGSSTRQLSSTTAFGSDGFAPPEQYLKSGIMGTYSDVYALGATLYFLLTAKIPPSSMERLAGEELTPPENLQRINRSVNDAVMRAMEVKGEQRLQKTYNLLESLRLPNSTFKTSNVIEPDVIEGQFSSSSSYFGAVTVTTRIECSYCDKRNYVRANLRQSNSVTTIKCWSCDHLFYLNKACSSCGAIRPLGHDRCLCGVMLPSTHQSASSPTVTFKPSTASQSQLAVSSIPATSSQNVTLSQKANVLARGMTPSEAVIAGCQSLSTVCPLCELRNYLSLEIQIGDAIMCCRCYASFVLANVEPLHHKPSPTIQPSSINSSLGKSSPFTTIIAPLKATSSESFSEQFGKVSLGIDGYAAYLLDFALQVDVDDNGCGHLVLSILPQDGRRSPQVTVVKKQHLIALKQLIEEAEQKVEEMKRTRRIKKIDF